MILTIKNVVIVRGTWNVIITAIARAIIAKVAVIV
jgi:hypothetical protein